MAQRKTAKSAQPKKHPAPALAADPARLSSIDALRGFVMFWIMGGDQIFPLLAKNLPSPFMHTIAAQFEHVPWHGLVFYDLIFPTFMFLAGTAMPFSFGKHLDAGGSRGELYAKAFKRSLGIVAAGFIFNGILRFEGIENFRLPGVLQRIGVTYFFGSMIYLSFNLRGRIAWVTGILLGYWALMMLIPNPQLGTSVLTPEGNLAGYVDRVLLSGRMCCYNFGDNEGLLSTLPAITTVVLGSFAGTWLHSKRPQAKKALGLAGAGLAAVALGYLWSRWFPLNKNLWTSSFALAAAGYSTLMLALFYWLMDIQGRRAWAFAFIVIGMNSITIYLAQEIVDFAAIAKFFVAGLARFAGAYQELVMVAAMLTVKIGALYLLWKQKVFLRL